MPYNNTPIAPPAENAYTGETKLPLARVKKIIGSDHDIGACAATSAFAITIATEMFIQHLVDSVHTVVKSEKRPRRTINYRDVAAAVAKFDNLEFLSDVVPRQVPFRQYVAKKGRVREGVDPAQQEEESQEGGPQPQQQQQQLSPKSQRLGAGTRFDVVSEEVKAPVGLEK